MNIGFHVRVRVVISDPEVDDAKDVVEMRVERGMREMRWRENDARG